MQTIAGLYLSLGPAQNAVGAYVLALGLLALAWITAVLLTVLIVASRLNEVVYDWARRAGRRQG